MENTFEKNLKQSWKSASEFVGSKLDDFNNLSLWSKLGLIIAVHYLLRWGRKTTNQ